MRHVLKIAALAGLLSVGATAWAVPASAQPDFRIQIGPDRPRVERRVIERRYVRPSRRTVCETRWRHGRRVEVCRTVRGPHY
jgi:hypothetical protein